MLSVCLIVVRVLVVSDLEERACVCLYGWMTWRKGHIFVCTGSGSIDICCRLVVEVGDVVE